MSQEYIDKLFDEIDTDTNASQLLTDLGMDVRYPHYTPQGTFRSIVNLRYFGDGRITEESPWHAHRVDLWSSDPKLAGQLKALGYNPRIRRRNNWRVGINRLQYDDIQETAQKLSEAADDAEFRPFLQEKAPPSPHNLTSLPPQTGIPRRKNRLSDSVQDGQIQTPDRKWRNPPEIGAKFQGPLSPGLFPPSPFSPLDRKGRPGSGKPIQDSCISVRW